MDLNKIKKHSQLQKVQRALADKLRTPTYTNRVRLRERTRGRNIIVYKVINPLCFRDYSTSPLQALTKNAFLGTTVMTRWKNTLSSRVNKFVAFLRYPAIVIARSETSEQIQKKNENKLGFNFFPGLLRRCASRNDDEDISRESNEIITSFNDNVVFFQLVITSVPKTAFFVSARNKDEAIILRLAPKNGEAIKTPKKLWLFVKILQNFVNSLDLKCKKVYDNLRSFKHSKIDNIDNYIINHGLKFRLYMGIILHINIVLFANIDSIKAASKSYGSDLTNFLNGDDKSFEFDEPLRMSRIFNSNPFNCRRSITNEVLRKSIVSETMPQKAEDVPPVSSDSVAEKDCQGGFQEGLQEGLQKGLQKGFIAQDTIPKPQVLNNLQEPIIIAAKPEGKIKTEPVLILQQEEKHAPALLKIQTKTIFVLNKIPAASYNITNSLMRNDTEILIIDNNTAYDIIEEGQQNVIIIKDKECNSKIKNYLKATNTLNAPRREQIMITIPINSKTDRPSVFLSSMLDSCYYINNLSANILFDGKNDIRNNEKTRNHIHVDGNLSGDYRFTMSENDVISLTKTNITGSTKINLYKDSALSILDKIKSKGEININFYENSHIYHLRAEGDETNYLIGRNITITRHLCCNNEPIVMPHIKFIDSLTINNFSCKPIHIRLANCAKKSQMTSNNPQFLNLNGANIIISEIRGQNIIINNNSNALIHQISPGYLFSNNYYSYINKLEINNHPQPEQTLTIEHILAPTVQLVINNHQGNIKFLSKVQTLQTQENANSFQTILSLSSGRINIRSLISQNIQININFKTLEGRPDNSENEPREHGVSADYGEAKDIYIQYNKEEDLIGIFSRLKICFMNIYLLNTQTGLSTSHFNSVNKGNYKLNHVMAQIAHKFKKQRTKRYDNNILYHAFNPESASQKRKNYFVDNG